jgi:hypothetical protein
MKRKYKVGFPEDKENGPSHKKKVSFNTNGFTNITNLTDLSKIGNGEKLKDIQKHIRKNKMWMWL